MSDRFKALALDLTNRKKIDQVLTRERLALLNDIIRPLVQEVQDTLLGHCAGMEFNYGHCHPYIRTRRGEEVRFIIEGSELAIVTRFGDLPASDSVDLSLVTRDLIADRIESFLRRSLL